MGLKHCHLLPPHALAAAACATLLLLPMFGWAQPAQLQVVLQGSQQVVHQLRGQLEDLRDSLRSARLASELADTALLNSSSSDAATLAQLATAALQARTSLTNAAQATAKAEQQLETATQLMRETAHQLALCQINKTPCDAQAPSANLQLARQAASRSAELGVVGKAPLANEIKELLLKAAGAQAAVDKLRAKAAGAYDQGDAATAAVLATEPPQGKPDEALAASAKTWTKAALDHPRQARDQVRSTQTAADSLVKKSLELRACAAEDTVCQRLHFDAAAEASLSFEKARLAAKATLDALDTAQFGLESRKFDPNASVQAIANAIELRKLLQSNPDVKSFFGEDAIGLSATNAGTNATIRWTMGNTQLLGKDRFSLIASTPKSDSGLSGFVNEADKLKNKTTLAAIWHRTRSENRLFGNAIVDYSLGVTWARDERTYFEASSPLKLVETKVAFNDWAVNSQFAALLPGNNNMLLMTLAKQRVREDGKAAIRCPVDPGLTAGLVTCTSGPLGPPTRAYNQLSSLELRSVFDKFGLGFKATHSREDNKLTLDMPVYLVRDLDNAKAPLTGGINFSWTKDGTGLKVGVFISAPLTLEKPDR